MLSSIWFFTYLFSTVQDHPRSCQPETDLVQATTHCLGDQEGARCLRVESLCATGALAHWGRLTCIRSGIFYPTNVISLKVYEFVYTFVTQSCENNWTDWAKNFKEKKSIYKRQAKAFFCFEIPLELCLICFQSSNCYSRLIKSDNYLNMLFFIEMDQQPCNRRQHSLLM